ncbi:MAG TPA: pentapeptide repeat-containing protein [Streptosporangiaceae bacterium]|jgi:hypothetical protein|nr:pentapeptide repeat-containing protein [Streptosporangiaceae bacterium]
MGTTSAVRGRRRRPALALALGGVTVCATVIMTTTWALAAPGSAGGCKPGSGPQLAGRHLSEATVSGYAPGYLRCANLTGADLAGLSLGQVDFTGAILRDADLDHADLTQATLNQADLSGANLSDATMLQVEARQAKLVGANLSGADLTQADLTEANLAKANLSGITWDETTIDHTTFTGATGIPPWNVYIGIVAVIIGALLLWGSVRRGLRATRAARGFGYSNATGSSPGLTMLRGILGSLVVALGFNLCLGGFIGEIISAAGPPVSQTCGGPLCTVGVSSGFIGIFGGVVVIIAGFVLRSVRRNTQPANVTPSWSGGPFAGTGSPF